MSKKLIAIFLSFMIFCTSVDVQASVYGVLYTRLSKTVLSRTGVRFEVSVEYERGVLPEGAKLEVQEIDEDSPEYEGYLSTAKDAVTGRVVDAGFMDIGFTYQGERIEPDGDVRVEIRKLDGAVDGSSVSVVHFTEPVADESGMTETDVKEDVLLQTAAHTEDVYSLEEEGLLTEEPGVTLETDSMPPETESLSKIELLKSNVIDDKVLFTTDSFSVYGIIYTVDFHFGDYEFSIPGGGYVTLSQLFNILSIDVDIADVEEVSFSSPDLAWVGKVEENTTIGEIKEANGLNVEYSTDLSESRIDEINSAVVTGIDWVLISLCPFDSKETLTVKMADGSVITIRVTDAAYPGNLEPGYMCIIQPWDTVTLKSEYSGTWSTDNNYVTVTSSGDGKTAVAMAGNSYGITTITHTIIIDDEEVTEKYKVRVAAKGTNYPNTITTVTNEEANIVRMRLLDFDTSQILDANANSGTTNASNSANSSGKYVFQKGINTYGSFKFLGWGYSPDKDWINTYAGVNDQNAYRPITNIVQNSLSGGYPVLANGRTYGKTDESLKYIFDENGIAGTSAAGTAGYNDKVVYENAEGLFRLTDDGYYEYDSYWNYAYYDAATSSFSVYDRSYYQQASGRKAIGFFPFNPIENVYYSTTTNGTVWNNEKKKTGENNTFINNFNDKANGQPYLPDKFYLNPEKGAGGHYNNYSTTWNEKPGYWNHHLGINMAVDFNIRKDGKNRDGQPTIFKFNGDDDMWVFVDGKLVLDIGGLHQPIDGEINFATGKASVQGISGTTDIYAAMGVDKDDFRDLDKPHRLEIFYLERGGCDSNCKISFNMKKEPPRYGTIHFPKVARNNTPVPDATFQLFYDAACTEPLKRTTETEQVIRGRYDQGIYGYITENVTATSDENGWVRFPKVLTGEYYMKEVVVPEGYWASQDVYRVKVDEDSRVEKLLPLNNEEPDPFTTITGMTDGKVINDRVIIDLKKVDQSGAPLSGAKFSIQFTPINANYQAKTIPKEVDGNGSITINGKDFLPEGSTHDALDDVYGLPSGTYVVTETNVPSGYTGISRAFSFSVDKGILTEVNTVDGVTFDDESKSFRIVNTLPEGRIGIRKVWLDYEGNVEENHQGDLNLTLRQYVKKQAPDYSVTVNIYCKGNGNGQYSSQDTFIATRTGEGSGTATLSWDWDQWTNSINGITVTENGSAYNATFVHDTSERTGTLTFDVDRALTLKVLIDNSRYKGTSDDLIGDLSFSGGEISGDEYEPTGYTYSIPLTTNDWSQVWKVEGSIFDATNKILPGSYNTKVCYYAIEENEIPFPYESTSITTDKTHDQGTLSVTNRCKYPEEPIELDVEKKWVDDEGNEYADQNQFSATFTVHRKKSYVQTVDDPPEGKAYLRLGYYSEGNPNSYHVYDNPKYEFKVGTPATIAYNFTQSFINDKLPNYIINDGTSHILPMNDKNGEFTVTMPETAEETIYVYFWNGNYNHGNIFDSLSATGTKPRLEWSSHQEPHLYEDDEFSYSQPITGATKTKLVNPGRPDGKFPVKVTNGETTFYYDYYITEEAVPGFTSNLSSSDWTVVDQSIKVTNQQEHKPLDVEAEPPYQKSLVENKTTDGEWDGTYTLSLDVTGMQKVATSGDNTPVDIVLVLDMSSSMNQKDKTTGKSRFELEVECVRTFGTNLLNLNKKYPQDNPVQFTLFTFGNVAGANLVTQTTSSEAFNTTLNGLTAPPPERAGIEGGGQGTNWEDALEKASNAATRSGVTDKYVIFVSDGVPTVRNTRGDDSWQGADMEETFHGRFMSQGLDVWGFGFDKDTESLFWSTEAGEIWLNYAVNLCYDESKGFAKKIVNDNNEMFVAISVFDEIQRMQDLVNFAYEGKNVNPNDYYKTAKTADDLSKIFDALFNTAKKGIDFRNVSINDPLTGITKTVASVDGRPVDFKYYKFSKGTDPETTVWANPPHEASFDKNTGTVNWDLSGGGVENGLTESGALLDGYTYRVSFTVWPDQDTYDVIMKLNAANGDKTKIQKVLDDNTDINKYLVIDKTTGKYRVHSNGKAQLHYTPYTWDEGTDAQAGIPQTRDYNHPSMETLEYKMKIKKVWNDSLYDNNRHDAVIFNIFEDNKSAPYASVTLNETNHWEEEIVISPGIISDQIVEGKKLNAGHTYRAEEELLPGTPGFNYEFTCTPVTPMLNNGVLGFLEDGVNALVGTNNARGSITLTKEVQNEEGEVIYLSDEFTFTTTIQTSSGIPASDAIWYKKISGQVEGEAQSLYTGATVKLKGGESIRFINLPIGYKMSFEETDTSEYEQIGTSYSYIDTSDKVVKPGNAVDGFIVTSANTWKYVTVTNKLDAIDFAFSKIFLSSDASLSNIESVKMQPWGNNVIGVTIKRRSAGTEDETFSLVYTLDGSDGPFVPTNISTSAEKYKLVKSNNDNIISFSMANVLPKKNASGQPYEYYLIETSAGGYSTYYGSQNNGTVTRENVGQIHNNGVIINQESQGVELPATGGVGTDIFYGIGLLLTLLSAITLLMKQKTY